MSSLAQRIAKLEAKLAKSKKPPLVIERADFSHLRRQKPVEGVQIHEASTDASIAENARPAPTTPSPAAWDRTLAPSLGGRACVGCGGYVQASWRYCPACSTPNVEYDR